MDSKNDKSEMSDSSLTIIVPIKNMEGRLDHLKSWLGKAIERQNEVILIIDKSQDDTRREVTEFLHLLGSHYVKVGTGLGVGPGNARDIGIQMASHTWVAFWDSDDIGDVAEINDALSEIGDDEAELLIGRYSQSANPVSVNTVYRAGELSESLIEIGLNPGVWRMAFKRDLISRISFGKSYMGEDQVFLARVLKKNPKIVLTERILYHYFTNVDGQLTSVKRNMSDLKISLNELAFELGSSQNQEDLIIFIMLWKQSFTLFTRGTIRDKLFLIVFLLQIQIMSSRKGTFLILNKGLGLLVIHLKRGTQN